MTAARDTPTPLFFVGVGFWRITPSRNSFVVLQLFPTTAVYSQARVPPDLNDLKTILLPSLKILHTVGSR